jgi:hypothetical protein
MILHADGSPMLHHFIRPEYLIALLEVRAFRLGRQDRQSDLGDGILPDACFDQPFRGPLEDSLGASDSFLKSQAAGIAALRQQTFIMCWSFDPSSMARSVYGENGERCEIQISETNLKKVLGYEWLKGGEWPPRRRSFSEFGGGKATAQLKEVLYTDGTKAISVVPSYFATAHKRQKFSEEKEIRIEVVAPMECGIIKQEVAFIQWPLTTFSGLGISVTKRTPAPAVVRIFALAADLGIAPACQ